MGKTQKKRLIFYVFIQNMLLNIKYNLPDNDKKPTFAALS